MGIIRIEDRLYRKNEVYICITTPVESMEYDKNVVNQGAKKLVRVLRSEVSQGFNSELIKELNRKQLEV